ncbi:M23 family metallopeptidase [Microbacterium sp. H83]|jgi:murein DD-endopeptidase MepM/ murein hydrolase activator NlpD|uniref:M23 family metallopeptidase n=1 Tax=Microbacterium sp. H83 TaxID=1827324 RepID=UPI0007F4092C|nr:M23 family metallopeptidase [Microbacterium sp. H83]OAN43326.1 peptidase M23 [Microbacterium sp. H83]
MSVRTRHRRTTVIVALLFVTAAMGMVGPAAGSSSFPEVDATSPTHGHGAAWVWPTTGPRTVAAAFRAPASEYGSGHRGVDVIAQVGAVVVAPAAGIVAFRGTVVDRPLITVDHGGGYISTFEPLVSTLAPGAVVGPGDPIGTVAVGGHAAASTLHVGVRLDGTYINPLLLFDDVPRAVLLPCCAPL